MKIVPSLIFLIVGHISFAQKRMDTTISKQILDSLKTENYRLKKDNKRLMYENRLLLKGNSIDTTYPKKDSTVISYFTKEKTLLKRIIKKYRSPDCEAFEIEEFFNDQELPEYIEYWTCDCRKKNEVAKDEIVFEKLLSRYERFVYDSMGRVVTRIFIYSGSMPGPRRFEYKYDIDGKATTQMKRISENQFWD